MTETFLYKDPSKGKPNVTSIEGMYILPEMNDSFLQNGKTMLEHIEDIKSMKLRNDDVFICTYQKSGTHWLWEITSILMVGEKQKARKETRMLDFTTVYKLDKLSSPRILNTHHPPHLLPREIKEKKIKLVYIYRNPKDVMISAYHFFKCFSDLLGVKVVDLDSYKKQFVGESWPYSYFKYMKEFKQYLEENPDIPSMVLSFEDLLKDTPTHVKRLAEFLGVDVSEQRVAEIIEMCKFDNMKKSEANFKDRMHCQNIKDSASVIFRKGKIGDWKNYLTVAESEMYDEVIERELQYFQFQFE